MVAKRMWKTGAIVQGNAIQTEWSLRLARAGMVWYRRGILALLRREIVDRRGRVEYAFLPKPKPGNTWCYTLGKMPITLHAERLVAYSHHQWGTIWKKYWKDN